jgi:hypothetical protein
MIRNLKALGIALAAIFAMSAATASEAAAQASILTTDGPVTLEGVNHTAVEGTNALTSSFLPFMFTARYECPNAKYTGHKYNETPHFKLIPNETSTFTVTPHYGLCKVSIGNLPVTVDMNGCDYVFHLEGTTPGVDTYTVKATIESCQTGKHITVTIWKTAAEHSTFPPPTPFCTVTITENAAGYLGLHAIDTTEGDVEIKGTVTGIVAHKVSPTSSSLCSKETINNAELDVDITVTGKNEAGAKTSIGLSHL